MRLRVLYIAFIAIFTSACSHVNHELSTSRVIASSSSIQNGLGQEFVGVWSVHNNDFGPLVAIAPGLAASIVKISKASQTKLMAEYCDYETYIKSSTKSCTHISGIALFEYNQASGKFCLLKNSPHTSYCMIGLSFENKQLMMTWYPSVAVKRAFSAYGKDSDVKELAATRFEMPLVPTEMQSFVGRWSSLNTGITLLSSVHEPSYQDYKIIYLGNNLVEVESQSGVKEKYVYNPVIKGLCTVERFDYAFKHIKYCTRALTIESEDESSFLIEKWNPEEIVSKVERMSRYGDGPTMQVAIKISKD